MKEGWKYSVAICEMEKYEYVVLEDNDVSHDLNMVNVQKEVEKTFPHLLNGKNGDIKFGQTQQCLFPI